MKRCIVFLLVTSSILIVITRSAYLRDRSETGAISANPSPTPPATGDILARPADVPPPPLWANKIRNPHVNYVASSSLTTFPVPAVIFRREMLAREGDWTEIRERIIYPAVNQSEKPIVAVVVEYFGERADIAVTLIWYGVGPSGKRNYSTANIRRDASGHFPTNSYLGLFSQEDE